LALGKQIVSELGFDPGVDTLGRWMAHHIAELISDAEQEKNAEAKRAKETLAADAIARLWQHRSSYDNRINPLHELKPILQVLRALDRDRNVWITNFGGPDGNAFAQVYDALRRLVIHMIVRKSGQGRQTGSATSVHQNEDEKEIIATIDHWLTDTQRAVIETAAKTKNESKPGTLGSKKIGKPAGYDADGQAKELISYARDALEKLSAELTGDGKPTKSKDERDL
jgi:hypothetical protein